MIRFPIILSFSILLISSVFSQSLDFMSVNTYGDGEGDDDEFNAMAADDDGNIYVFGGFSGVVDYYPGTNRSILNTNSSNELILAKYDSNHNLVWINVFDGLSNNYANDIALDASGNILICGSFVKSMDMDPGPNQSILTSVTYNNADGFFAKYNAQNGSLIWAKAIGGSSVDNAHAIAADQQNNIYLTGAFSDTIDMDPSASSSLLIATGNYQDPYLARYDSNGNISWAFSLYGSSLPGYGRDVEISPDNAVVLGGVFNNTVDFDPSSSSAQLSTTGNLDAFVAKYSLSGAYQWAIKYGSTSEDYLNGLVVGADGQIYTTGYFQSTADFDPSNSTHSITSNGNKDVYLANYDSSGAFDWAFKIGGSSVELGHFITSDNNSNLYIGGYSYSSVDFDPSTATHQVDLSSAEAFMASYDTSGSFNWVSHTLGNNLSQAFDGVINSRGKAIYCGTFRNDADLDPSQDTFTVSALNNSNSSFVSYCQKDTGYFITGFSTEDREGGYDEATRVVHDDEGNYYVAGYFNGGIDFGSSANPMYVESGGTQAGFLLKKNISGTSLWVKTFDGSDGTSIDALSLDQSGNILLGGYYYGIIDLDPGTATQMDTAVNGADLFICKLDSGGNFLWGHSMGGNHNESALDICADYGNNILVTGYFRSNNMDFDPGSSSTILSPPNYYSDVFVLKLDSSGSFIWALNVGGSNYDYGYAISSDSNNNIYVGGRFKYAANFNPLGTTHNITSYGAYDAFIVKYNSNGIMQWAHKYGGNEDDYTTSLDFGSDGYLYATGNYEGTADFDPGAATLSSTANGGEDVFVMRLDTNGNTDWVQCFGSGMNSYAHDDVFAIKEYNGNVYVGGSFYDATDFDPDTSSDIRYTVGGMDAFITVYDTGGSYKKTATFGGSSTDAVRAVSVIADIIVLGGPFYATCDFDPDSGIQNRSSMGDKDIYLLQLGQMEPCDTLLDTLQITTCGKYISPGNKIYTLSGIYYDTVKKHLACDSIYRLELTILPVHHDTQTVHTCSTYFNPISNSWINSPGYHFDTLTNRFGCDSIIATNILFDTTSSFIRDTGCVQYYWNGAFQNTSGSYFDTLTNYLGCDSIIQLELVIYDTSVTQITTTACDFFISPGGKQWNTSGLHYDTFKNQHACDSIVIYNLTINSSSYSTINLFACDSFISPSGKYRWYQSGAFQDTIPNYLSCDSIISIQLTVGQTNNSSISPVVCDTFISPSGKTWTTSGYYVDTIQNLSGCDSVININLTVNQTKFDTIYPVSCNTYISPSGKHIWKTSGIYSDTLSSYQNCDSIFIINLTIKNSSSSTIYPVACNTYISPGGKTLTKTGLHYDTIQNFAACDSIIEIHLTVNSSTSSSLYETACNSYSSPSNKYVWTKSGTYQDTIPNFRGCDSILSIHLTANKSTTSSLHEQACNSYTSPSGKHKWFSSGTYFDTLTNYSICDSIITIYLTVNKQSSSSIVAEGCDSFTSPSGNHIWTKSGSYTDTIPNHLNCDSIIHIQLRIHKGSLTKLQAEVCDSFISPLGKILKSTGRYFDTLKGYFKCDSIIEINLIVNATTYASINPQACDVYPSPSGKFSWKQSGTYYDTIQNHHNCDSIIEINLKIVEVDTSVSRNGNMLTANAQNATYQWYHCIAGIPITGATGKDFNPPANGSYAVIVTEQGCTDTSSCYIVTGIGLDESEDMNVLIYPNPSTGSILIHFEQKLSEVDVEIRSVDNKLVYRKAFEQKDRIDIELNEPAGMYFIYLITHQKQVSVYKLIML
jgi:hypothetical protein